jgi:tetratricopeptide (TPR) repeat protein
MTKACLSPFGLIIALAATTNSPVRAQAETGWIGKRVVPAQSMITLVVSGEAIERVRKEIEFFRVEQVAGASVWITAADRRTSGWVNGDELVLVDRAVDYFSRRTRENPGDSFSFAARAILWRDQGELDKAIADHDKAIRLDPKAGAYYCSRGLTWQLKKRDDRALADFDQAVALDPGSVPALIGRGDARVRRKEYFKAIADFSEAVWLDPLATTAYRKRGLAWSARSEFAKAIVDDNMAIRLDGNGVETYCDRAVAWRGLGKFDKALADFNQAIKIDQTCMRADSGRAWIWATCPDERYRDGNKAVDAATRVCDRTGWRDEKELEVLAAACAQAGDFASAIKWQTKANALHPDALAQAIGQSRLRLFRENRTVCDPESPGQAGR